MITVVSLFVIFHVVNCSFEYVPTIILLPTEKLFNFQPGIPTNASKHVDVYQLLVHSKLFARPYFLPLLHNHACTTYNCTSSYPIPFFSAPIFQQNILHWCLLFPWYHQILAHMPNSLHWCVLFPWYWPFKFKHAHPRQIFYTDIYRSLGTDHSNSSMLTHTKNSMSMSSVPLVLTTLMSTVPLVPYWAFKHAFILMHHCVVTTKVSSYQHHNKNQLHLSYYSQHRHVVKEPY